MLLEHSSLHIQVPSTKLASLVAAPLIRLKVRTQWTADR